MTINIMQNDIAEMEENTVVNEGSKRVYYSIGEVAKMLGENTSLIRFWSDTFHQKVNPVRNKKGNRLYSPQDVETLKLIHMMVNIEGLTLEGVAKRLQNESKGNMNKLRALEALYKIRNRLEAIHKSM